MRNLLLTILASCAALGISCAPQTGTNVNGNVANANATPLVNSSPASNSNVKASKSDEEETVTIRLEAISPTPPPPAMPCRIIPPPDVKLDWAASSPKTKVEWVFENRCTERDVPVTVQITFKQETGGAFGPDACDNRFFIDFVRGTKDKRVVSRSAISPNGTYKYGVSAFLSDLTGGGQKVAEDVDPEVQISGHALAK
jgi:hypothetical protein